MGVEEYLQEVTDQVRSKKAKQWIGKELRDHIEDQADEFRGEGLSETDALEKAVHEMGDPVVVGMELDRVHRPHIPAGMIGFICLLGALSIAAQYVLVTELGDTFQISMVYRHVLFTIMGIAAMLFICAMDYTIVGKYGRLLAASFLIVLTFCMKFLSLTMNGASRWFLIGPLTINGSVLALLYLPLFGGVLYAYRGQGYRGLAKIAAWMLLPVYLVLRMPALSMALILLLAEAIMLGVSVKDGWYQVDRKKVILTVILIPCLMTAAGVCRMIALNNYQSERLQGWLFRRGPAAYILNSIQDVLENCRLIGASESALKIVQQLPDWNQDYFLISMAAKFGVLSVAGILFAMALLCWWMLRVAAGQKNLLGKIVGLGSVLAILLQLLLNVSMLTGLVPITISGTPLFSYTGSGTAVTYALLGFVLSIYRNKDVVRDPVRVRLVNHI